LKNFFDFRNLKGDFLGGITAGIVALPLALAFGVSSGLGPSAGLYGAIFLAFFAALFGGTNTQISGPTAPMTAVSMVIISGILASFNGDLEQATPAILTVFMLAGIFQIIIGLIKLGTYIKYIPHPVISGFMTAIGLIILFTQVLPTLGYYPKDDMEYVKSFLPRAEEVILDHILHDEAKEGLLVLEDFQETIDRAKNVPKTHYFREAKTLASEDASGVIGALSLFPTAIKHISWLELILSLSTIAIIFGFKKITTLIPSTLVALFTVSSIAIGLDLNYRPIQAIPGGLPLPYLEVFSEFNFEKISPYIVSALTLALLGAIDSLLTSVVADNITKTKHQSNKELIGQGIGNSIAALFGGIPGAGATIRTVVNINAGGSTRISGMVSALLLLVILLVLGPIASQIPAAVLSGILITVGLGVIDYKGLKAIPNMPKNEVFVMILVLSLSVFWNLVFAVAAGLVMASLLFMKDMGDITDETSKLITLGDHPLKDWTDEQNIPKDLTDGVYIKHVNGPLFFGSINEFQKVASHIPDTAHTIIFRLEKMAYLDQSGLYALEDTLTNLVTSGKSILLCSITTQPLYMLEGIDIIPSLVPKDQLMTNLQDCVIWIKQNKCTRLEK
jgi:SulP family sulfate permease